METERGAAQEANTHQKTELDQLIISMEALKQNLTEKEEALDEEKKLHQLSEEKLKEMEQAQQALESQVHEYAAEKNQLATEFSKLKEIHQATVSRFNETEKNLEIENQLKVIISVHSI